LAAVALLPDEHEHAIGDAQRGQVEDHCLGGQQDGAKRSGQQDQRDECDEAEHEREAAVDGVDEVGVGGPLAADAEHAGLPVEGVSYQGECVGAGG
jgi:hypothetical protein